VNLFLIFEVLLQIKNWERRDLVICVIERKMILAKTETNSKKLVKYSKVIK